MSPRVLRALAGALALAASAGGADELDPRLARALREIDADGLAAHVRVLAADEMAGRAARRPEGLRAAEYVRDRFRELGLEPLPGHDWFLPVGDHELSPNVAARLPGKGPDLVLIGAHYDHLAPREDAAEGEDAIFNGADDNASGTAALLEIAQAFRALPEPPAASIVFVAFTGEELGLVGSRHLVAHPPFALDHLRAMLNMDMVSRGPENLIFCEGGDTAPELRDLCDRWSPEAGLEVRHGEHPDWLGASDHAPFMKAGVPALYFGVEDHEDYHQVGDEAEKIEPELAARVARLVFLVADSAASAD